MFTPASTADWMLLLGMLTTIGATSSLTHAWVLKDSEPEREIVRLSEEDDEPMPAAA
jgi:hypothetical protein